VPSTGRVKSFQGDVDRGAYWLGDEKNQQLQRIYGTAFFNSKDLDATLSDWRRSRRATIVC